jgi:hypothetical protein
MPSPGVEHRTTRHQDAVRLLFLLSEAGTTPSAAAPLGSVRVVHSQMRLQALDFWMRNPDYLADELLTEQVAGRRQDGIALAKAILESDEPDLRRYPMVRYLFGAYEPLDDALAILRSAGLVHIVREGDPDAGRIREHHFFLLDAGLGAAKKLVQEAPALVWYRDRASLVAAVAADSTGSQLKDRQYEKIEYARTKLGTTIGSVADSVRRRVREIELQQSGGA